MAYRLQVLWLVPLQNLHEKLKMHDFDYQQCTKPAYTQKDQHFDAKSSQNLNILKKIKKNDSEKPPNLHILKKSKKIKN